MTGVREVMVNGRWPLLLPEHRADRPEWPWWEATRLAAMRHHIGVGDVVWDVGAEEGDFPALWASWGAGVVMAEPNPRVWPNIKLIWDANGLPVPLECWNGFLGDEAHEDVSMARSYGDTWPWPPSVEGPVIGDHGFCQLGERPDIPTTTICTLVDVGVPPPTVITMDVEGSELHVLRGAEGVLLIHRPKVFVSIHPEFMHDHYGIGDGVEHVRAFMLDRGYRDTFLAIDHEHHWMFLPGEIA